LEQIRNDICYHNANVKIVAVGGGFAYGALGMTHHTTEDLAIMRTLPYMTVVAPGDPVEVAMATRAIVEKSGPCYLRLAKTGEPMVHQTQPDFKLGTAIMVREGSDLTLISTGDMLYNALKSAELLAQAGIQARVLSMHTLKPLDMESVLIAARETGTIVTIEEHSIIGGLGSAVAEVLAEMNNSPITFKRIAMKKPFCSEIGNQEYLREVNGLSVRGIVESIHSLLRNKK
jgi:transketolase